MLSSTHKTARPTGREQIKNILKRKHNEREEEFAKLRALYKLGVEEGKIVTLNWDDLIEKLQCRQLTATKVLEAFIAKTLEVAEKCNPVTDFIPQAHVWAKDLDSLEEVKGPLHGIPFCVKDDTNVIGMDTTHGFGKRLYDPATESAVIVKVLQDLGAIPFCKTNVPQGLSSFGGDNPVFGLTTNAHNSKLTSGGSSSGTGVLVGRGGVCFGTGSDMAGSLRIPAHFNGVVTIKPTNSRLSLQGVVPPSHPASSPLGLNAVVGIIGQTTSIVTTVFRGMVESGGHTRYDAIVPPLPWDASTFESTKRLRIGYFSSLPYFPTMGDSRDIVLRAKEALESRGHTLLPFTMPDAFNFMPLFVKLIMAETWDFNKIWEGEPLTQSTKVIVSSARLPKWVKTLFAALVKSNLIPAIHSKRLGPVINIGATKLTDLADAMEDKKRLIQEMFSSWEALNLDTLICNVFPFPALREDAVSKLLVAVCYTVIWNLVEFPTGVVPFGTETGEKLTDFDDEGDMLFKLAKQVIPESIGAPIGIQVVGKPFQEEMVLRVMKELEPFNTFRNQHL